MIVTAGELLVEFVSAKRGCGLSALADYSGPYASGAPAIFIDQAARMGARTAIWGGVGRDPFGDLLTERLSIDGVNVAGVHRHPTKTTGTAFVSYNDDGSRMFVFHLKGTAAESVAVQAPPDGPFTVHISGSALGSAPARSTLLELCDVALKNGGKISYDPNVRPELLNDEASLAALHEVVSRSHILLPSEADLAILYPNIAHDKVVADWLSAGVEIVVLKLGENGAEVYSQTKRFKVAGHPVQEVDPTGAGDCFCGAFLGLLDQGAGLLEAATYANAAGALHVTQTGPMELNPTPDQINAFLKGTDR